MPQASVMAVAVPALFVWKFCKRERFAINDLQLTIWEEDNGSLNRQS